MLSLFFGLLLAYSIPTLLGFLTLRALEATAKVPTANRLPTLVVGAAGTIVGWVLVTLTMRAQHTFGLTPSRLFTLAIPLVIALALLAALRRQAFAGNPFGPVRPLTVCVLALLALPLLAELGLQPLPGWDAWEFWAARAKVWFFTGDLGDNRLQRNEDYPPAISLMMLWIARAANAWRDDLFGTISFLHLLSAATVIFWALRNRLGENYALVAVAFTLGAPLLAVHGVTGGYADLPLACALVSAAALLLCVRTESPSLSQYAVPALLGLCLPFYKIPGIFWMIIFFVGLATHLLSRRPTSSSQTFSRRSAVICVFLVSLIVVVLAFIAPQGAVKIGNYTIKFAVNDGAAFIFNELFITASFMLLWLGVAILYSRTPSHALPNIKSARTALSIIVVLGLVFVLAAVFFSNSLEWWADGSTLNRALIHIAPTAILLAVVQAYSMLEKSQD